ncbi:hypothetical protein C0993_000462 [Termitomyces sp. T159_Od127]|nr:hypothetical protein C0993_000462 [Termitomyces sp. T159_Od127]
MPQLQRDDLRSKVPEVMTNRKQRKAIEYFNHINTVQAAVALHAPSHQSPPSHSNNHRQKQRRERTAKPVVV